MDNQDKDWTAYITDSPALTPREKALRDKFVKEYLEDFDAVKAAIRCGYNASFALEYATRFLQESYVQQRITELTKAQEIDIDQEEKVLKRKILFNLMKEAQSYGKGTSHIARVAALKTLTEIFGMKAVIKTETEVTHKGGVMTVPGISNISDWEKEAKETQEKLMRDASSV